MDQEQAKDSAATFWIILIIIAIMIYIQAYAMYKYTLSSKECSYWDKFYKNTNASIQNNTVYTYPDKKEERTNAKKDAVLLDYDILSAYNCCSSGAYKNDYVNTCILINIIKQGVRCLDFEIYSLKDEPIIASSTESNYNVKETFNFVKFSEAMKIIANNAFSSATAPNPNDPLIINLRIKSTNIKMYNNLSKIFKSYNSNNKLFASKLYSYDYRTDSKECQSDGNGNATIQLDTLCHNNLGKVPLINFKSKIIVIVDGSNKTYLDTDLYEWVNLTSISTNAMTMLRYNSIKNIPSLKEIQENNKQTITMVIPDNQSNPDNPSGKVCRAMGCQMVAMRFQLNDDHLQENIKYFNNFNSAFVLKPIDLRNIPVLLPSAKAQDLSNSYEEKEIKNKLYDFKI